MPNLSEIQSQISNLDGLETFFGRKEIKELPNVLWDDEKIENIVQGTYSNGNGILVATNKRLIFVNKGLLFGLKVEDFPYEKITTIQYETGLIFGKLTIFTSGNKAIIDNVIKTKVRVFGDWVRARISATQKNALANDSYTTESLKVDIADQLERLAKMKDQGILTEEEFGVQKKKLLNS